MNRILFITSYPINNKTAGQNYSLKLLEDLSQEYKIDIAYWKYPNHEMEIKSNNNLRIIKRFDTNGICKTFYYSILKFCFPLFAVRFDKMFAKWVKENHCNYDLVYFDFSQTFIYSKYVSNTYKVMMCHDIIGQKYQRKRCSFLYNWLVNMSEKKLLKNGNSIFTFSSKDQLLLKKSYGIESDVVSFYIGNDILNINLISIDVENYFVFYGAWNRKENSDGLKWFLKEVYPSCSDIYIKIIGGALDADLKTYILNLRNIEYVGFVDNPYKIIAKSKALIAPLFSGAGVKVKVIESLSLGTPVIGTDIAFEGIDNIVLNNRNFLVKANNKKEFIETIKELPNISSKEKFVVSKLFLKNYKEGKFKEKLKKIF